MSRFPTQDLQQRLLQNGGRVPYGLFRPNQWRAGKSKIPPGANDPIKRLVEEFRAMLRDLTNLNVRQPSHMAPPFRAQQFTFQQWQNASVLDPFIVPIGGNLQVPIGSIAVVNFVGFVATTTFGGINTAPHWGEAGNDPTFLTLLRNGQTIPGWEAILPSISNGAQLDNLVVNFTTQNGMTPIVPTVPITLLQQDSLAFTTSLSVVGDTYLTISGYTYPIEQDGDGVRGTIADRG